MNKLFTLAAVAGLALSTAVVAEEAAAPAAAPAATTTTTTTTTTEVAAPAAEVKALELKDGTKIEVTGEDVAVVNADGTKTPAPDGTHELKDGTTVTTKGGKVAK